MTHTYLFSIKKPSSSITPDFVTPDSNASQSYPSSQSDPDSSQPYPDSSQSDLTWEAPSSLVENLRREKLQQQLEQQKTTEELYEKVLAALPGGEFFHTVPDRMKANVPVIIQAGIAKTITQKELDQLQVKGSVKIRQNVRYDPLGVEIKLVVDDTMLKVRQIVPSTPGKQPVILGDPTLWMWEVTPLKQGKSTITILAVINLKLPDVQDTYQRETVVFKEEREIEINPGYTMSQLVANYWKEVSGLIFGSGSLAALLKWLIDRQKEKSKPTNETKDAPGFARFLSSQQEKKGR